MSRRLLDDILAHELVDLARAFEGQRPIAGAKLGNQRAVVQRKTPERARLHRRVPKERFDTGKHVGVGDHHTPAYTRIFPTVARAMTEISSLPSPESLCHLPDAVGAGAIGDPSDLYRRFESIKPDGLSWAAWAVNAGVSRSFFTDVKEGTDPGIGRVERVLAVVGLSLPEFFADKRPMIPVSRSLPSAEVCAVLLRDLVRKISPTKMPSEARLAILGEALRGTLALLADDPAAANDPALALRTVQGLASRLDLPPS